MNNRFKLIVFGREEEELSSDAKYEIFESKRQEKMVLRNMIKQISIQNHKSQKKENKYAQEICPYCGKCKE